MAAAVFVPNNRAELKAAVDACLAENIDGSQCPGQYPPMVDWDTSKVTDMSSIFEDAYRYGIGGFNQPIGNWDTSAVTDMSSMFSKAGAFNQDISGWDTSSVTNMRRMLARMWNYESRADSFSQPIGGWDTSKVKNMEEMFSGGRFNGDISGWDTSSVTTMKGMFSGAGYFGYSVIDKHIGNWNTGNVKNMEQMFRGATAFNQDISGWDTSSVTTMKEMFNSAGSFGMWTYHSILPIGGWDTSAVTDMSSMFDGAEYFNQNIGGWDTSAVTDMSSMFDGAEYFNQNIGGWDTSKVKTFFTMFREALVFNQPLGGWDTRSVTDMSLMFTYAEKFNQNIGAWDVKQVKNMAYMFMGAEKFNQNIGDWNLASVSNMRDMFSQKINIQTAMSYTLCGSWYANLDIDFGTEVTVLNTCSCTCSGGAPVTGDLCTADGMERCACAAGEIFVNGACTTCPTGKYNDGGVVCRTCAAGKYGTSSTCIDCAAGRYQTQTAQTTCIDCVRGKYSATIGADTSTACVDCVRGKYSETVGTVTCTDCAAGKYSETVGTDTSNTCSDCAAGKYSVTVGANTSNTCTDCAVGKYSETVGTATCTDCAAGKYSETVGTTTCTDCAAGKYSETNDTTTCTDCAAGKYSETVGKTTCIDCGSGKYSATIGADTSTMCIDCAAGKYSAAIGADTLTTCTDCAAGKYSVTVGADTSTTCIDCAAGKYSATIGADTSTTCVDCVAGKYSATIGAGTSAACLDCAAGKHTERKWICTECAGYRLNDGTCSGHGCKSRLGDWGIVELQGHWDMSTSGLLTGLTSSSDCTSCIAGRWSAMAGAHGTDTEVCADCAAGKYSETIAADTPSTCIDCDAGKYTERGLICNHSWTDPGSWTTTRPDGITRCFTGHWTTDMSTGGFLTGQNSSSVCISCSAGKSSAAGAHGTATEACIDCVAGKYAPNTGMEMCTDCVAGKYSEEVGKDTESTCIDCAAGKYSETIAADTPSTCTDCAAGKWSGDIGLASGSGCKLCEVARFSNQVGLASPCPECTAGKYQPLRGQVSCIGCPPGFYQPKQIHIVNPNNMCAYSSDGSLKCVRESIDFCWECGFGQYNPLEAQTSCVECAIGKFAHILTRGSSSDTCADCPAGYYQESVGKHGCNGCDAGKYSATVAASSGSTCTECARGKYSSSAAVACTECESGKRSDNPWHAYTCSPTTYAERMACIISGKWLGVTQCESCPSGTGLADTGSYLINRRGQISSGWEDVNPNREPCEECTEGRYLDGGSCTDCPAGYRQYKKAQTTCISCGRGSYQSSPGQSTCESCATGKYNDEQGISVCKVCDSGKYTRYTGQISCETCPIGYYGDAGGICKACAAGLFSDTIGATSSNMCKACPAGTYSETVAATSSATCKDCAVGKLSGQGQTSCTDCEVGKINEQPASTSCFLCEAGKYYSNSYSCKGCPEGRYDGSPNSIKQGLMIYQCSECAAGKWSAVGSTTCVSIDTSFVPNDRAELKAAVAVCLVINADGSECGSNPPISQWDTSKVTDMREMFSGASSFNQDISSWDVSAVTNMNEMFRNAKQFNQPLNSWDVSAVTDMSGMFGTGGGAGGIVLKIGTRTIYGNSAEYIDVTGYAIYANQNRFNQDIGAWDVSAVRTMASMFRGSFSFNQDIRSWSTSSVTDMSSMFREALSFDQDISGWNTNKVTTMSNMFRFAVTFNQDVSAWNTGAVTTFVSMFRKAVSFDKTDSVKLAWPNAQSNDIYFQTLGWGSYVPAAPGTAYTPTTKQDLICAVVLCIPKDDTGGYGSITGDDWESCATAHNDANDASGGSGGGGGGSDGGGGGYGGGYGYGNRRRLLLPVTEPSDRAITGACPDTYGYIADWDVSKITDMSELFAGRTPDSADPARSITGWDVSSVTTMNKMFLGARTFNQDISGWNTASVEDMSYMFSMTFEFNRDLSGWDVSSVTDMNEMFFAADAYNPSASSRRRLQQKPVWDVSSVTSMRKLFADSTFNDDISAWNTANVEDMSSMFSKNSHFNRDISGWNTAKVENMGTMFLEASLFNQNLSAWDVSSVTNMNQMFKSASSYDKDPLRGTWMSSTASKTEMFVGVTSGSIAPNTCPAGQGVVAGTGTATTSTVCETCPSGKFSSTDGLTACQSCSTGKFSSTDDLAACQDHTTCSTGEGLATAGTASADTVCEACTSGKFSTTDDLTVCQDQITCPVGQGLATAGTTSADTECETCPLGKFSTAADLNACQDHSTCSAGNGLATAGTASADTVCQSCPTGKFSGTDDLSACQDYTTCPVGQGFATSGTASADTACETCPTGKFSDTDDMTACQDHATCPAGEGLATAGTASTDTVCETCPVGKSSDSNDMSACRVSQTQIESKADSIIADLAVGTTTRTLSKTEVDDATLALIQDIKTKRDAGTVNTIDLTKARKFTKAYVMLEGAKNTRYRKVKTQEKQLAAQVVTLFSSERQSTNPTVKKAWKRNFANTMKKPLESENIDEKLASPCAKGCSSTVAAPSATVDCSSYDNENCCSYDIANDPADKPTLVQPFDVGSFAIVCDGSTIISKQHWVSEDTYAMECWDDDDNEFANTQGNMVVGDEYKCNGYNVWVGSQGVTNGCDTCDDNASCDSSTDPVTCTCDAPFTGNGTHCDADQCSSLTDVHNCHADATCNNTDTGFTCACNTGFLGDGVNCEADQCLTNNGGCDADAECVDTFGADPVCTCKAGFVDWSPQGQTGMSCDPDQCQVANVCEAEANGGICTDDEDGYTCSCRPTVFVANTLAVGTINNNTVHQCVNVDECDSASPSHDCGANYECQDLTPSANGAWRGFLCNCPTGYYVTIQSQQTVCIDVNECNLPEWDSRHHGCPEHTTCTNYVVNTHGMTHSCSTCESGYVMATQGGADTCVDINECQNSPCSNGETCTNFDGGYICWSGSVNSANDTFCEDNNINSGNTPNSTCDGWLEYYNDLYCCGEGLACQILEKMYNCGECCTK